MSRKNAMCYGLTGGGTGSLDSILSTVLTDNSVIFTLDTGVLYAHYYDSSSAVAESSPDVIKPDDLGVGDAGRWLALPIWTFLAALDALGALTPVANKIPHFTSATAATALEITEQTVIGRITGGNIAALSVAQLRTLLALGNAYATNYAVQADMETATSTTTVVSPGMANFHPGVAKAWLKWLPDGSYSVSRNITSVTDNGTGNWTINIATDFSSANWAYALSVETSYVPGGMAEVLGVVQSGQTAGTLNVTAVNPTDALTERDGAAMTFIGFGDQ